MHNVDLLLKANQPSVQIQENPKISQVNNIAKKHISLQQLRQWIQFGVVSLRTEGITLYLFFSSVAELNEPSLRNYVDLLLLLIEQVIVN